MLVNSDFYKRAIVTTDRYRWTPSPQPGVERVMLDRVGGEQARATSIVRYGRGTRFPGHVHPGGEEILVLAGTFSEGGHDSSAGWYLRNPPGSSHRPSSDAGATLFVKLGQMRSSENRSVRIDTRDPLRWTMRKGRRVCPLFDDEHEWVRLERAAGGEALFHGSVEGAELLILEGDLREHAENYVARTWLRLPKGEYPAIVAGPGGATYYLKTGPLPVAPRSHAC